jgi:hypothetical protein
MNDSKLHPLAVLGRAPSPGGTSLQGYCTTTYVNLVALLGEPHVHMGDKTTVEWFFRCHNGTVFEVYDWMQCVTPTEEYAWHIGGNSPDALAAFERHTGLKTQALRLIPIDETSNQ